MQVSAGIIVQDGKILVCQRPEGRSYSGLWEFPGGKREPHESAEMCLVRECREELCVELFNVLAFAAHVTEAPTGEPLEISFFLAEIACGTPSCQEHAQIRWIEPAALFDLPFCPADAALLPSIAERFASHTQ